MSSNRFVGYVSTDVDNFLVFSTGFSPALGLSKLSLELSHQKPMDVSGYIGGIFILVRLDLILRVLSPNWRFASEF
jgi:hypothetical protein